MGLGAAVEYTIGAAEVAPACDRGEDIPCINRSVDGSNRAGFGNAVWPKQGAVEVRSD